jgi:hypothetical protein
MSKKEDITPPASQIMYRINGWGFDIEEVSVDRVTESFVFPSGKGYRESKDNYFETRAAAKEALIKREQDKVTSLLYQLGCAEDKLELAKGIEI